MSTQGATYAAAWPADLNGVQSRRDAIGGNRYSKEAIAGFRRLQWRKSVKVARQAKTQGLNERIP
ncbi:MAG: hypothetical protein A3G41_00970 [Elusimicrobia bacterium RIFCSPLOWO2_12_FULL_59_9]|nr:MAG: hypothetical protein A3G41_00970 [Elusimicrobia bacterium RIFCSPLOWO2_12_FULL_59_9]